MSREIKFRAYKNGKMFYFTLDIEFDCCCGWLEGCVLEQFIGVEDAKESDIYEG